MGNNCGSCTACQRPGDGTELNLVKNNKNHSYFIFSKGANRRRRKFRVKDWKKNSKKI